MADDSKNFNPNQGMYIGPMVYFGTYPMPLPMWQQMYMNNLPGNMMPPMGNAMGYGMENTVEKQFKLPFPEDEKE